MVSGAVYEVQTGEHHGSALSLAGSLLSGKLNINLGTATAADNFISVKVANMTAIMQALDSDTRFKVLSSPQVRVSSGKSATFTVGEQVPVLGAITYPQGGSSPVQSVDYRSSGVIFSIAPDVHDAAIDVHVDQQVSSFVNTTTGVNNSPTLTTRQISTNVSMADGDVIVIGGLRLDKDAAGSSGLSFLPAFLKAKMADRSHSEILLFLQLKKL
jgi:type II secretory pathway component GspD/PulD (secretin)